MKCKITVAVFFLLCTVVSSGEDIRRDDDGDKITQKSVIAAADKVSEKMKKGGKGEVLKEFSGKEYEKLKGRIDMMDIDGNECLMKGEDSGDWQVIYTFTTEKKMFYGKRVSLAGTINKVEVFPEGSQSRKTIWIDFGTDVDMGKSRAKNKKTNVYSLEMLAEYANLYYDVPKEKQDSIPSPKDWYFEKFKEKISRKQKAKKTIHFEFKEERWKIEVSMKIQDDYSQYDVVEVKSGVIKDLSVSRKMKGRVGKIKFTLDDPTIQMVREHKKDDDEDD